MRFVIKLDIILQKAAIKMSGKNSIIITELSCFDIKHILECGQIFRFDRLSEGEYRVYSKDKTALVIQKDGKAEIITDDTDYFYRFFDLGRDYSQIKDALRDRPFMREAIEYGGGIRILNQDRWEMLISFIISANNHIPRIKGIIDRLCTRLGERMDGYYAFPTAEKMAERDAEFYASIGAGYRAPYLAATARAVAEGFDLDAIADMDGKEGGKRLCSLLGVGPKVADCILLFGYHKQDVFPVDTWIKKVYKDVVGDGAGNNALIRKKLIEIYGEYSGYAQQYLFYNKRGN